MEAGDADGTRKPVRSPETPSLTVRLAVYVPSLWAQVTLIHPKRVTSGPVVIHAVALVVVVGLASCVRLHTEVVRYTRKSRRLGLVPSEPVVKRTPVVPVLHAGLREKPDTSLTAVPPAFTSREGPEKA